MKILAIDDQQLVLLPLKKKLTELGYEVEILTEAKKAKFVYEAFLPDLVIVDMNMPEVSGLEIVKFVKQEKGDKTPIMVLSGNTQDDLIVEAFELGIDDYMKKPLSIEEVCARVKRLIGFATNHQPATTQSKTIIEKRCVGVVIPCYNEEERLLSKEFLNFVEEHSGYHLCFVNDGSTDRTFEVLQELKKGREEYISVYDCFKNGGKAEAVRQGMLFLEKFKYLDYIGFLDADLSTNLKDFDALVSTIETSSFKIVSGSRISRMGANITKESARKIISLSINYIIRKILGMDFKDTQCGAKIMNREIIQVAFQKKFVTKWLFDVEIFMRMRKHFGTKKAQAFICEQPLNRWVHADGSKLSMKDSVKIVFQLAEIAWVYRKNKNKNVEVVSPTLEMGK